jgi:predicted Zn-dependent protease with MMP-like domain
VLLDHLETLVLMVVAELPEEMVFLDSQVVMEIMVPQVQPDSLEILGAPDRLGQAEGLVLMEDLVQMEQLAVPEQPVLEELMETLEQ